MQNLINRCVVLAAFAVIFPVVIHAQPSTWTWTGNDSEDRWSWWNNWNPNNTDPGSYGIKAFNASGTFNVNNDNELTADHRWSFGVGAGTYTIFGTAVQMSDFGGSDPEIKNDSSNLQTINLNLTGDGSAGDPFQIGANGAGLTFGGTFNNNGSAIRIYSDNGHSVNFNGVVSGSGALTIDGNTIVNIGAASTYTGDTEINEGSVRLNEGGSLGGTIVRIGRSSGSDAAQFYIADANGGTTEDATIVFRAGSSGTLTAGGLNTSGNNTFSGTVALDNNATLSAAAGGRTIFSGAISDGLGAGTFGVAINAAGTVQLAGASGNSGQSSWTIQAGTLELNKTVGVNAINSAGITIQSGGTMLNLASGQISDSGNVTVQNGGAWNLNNNNESINSLSLASGSSLTLGSGDLTLINQANGTWAGTISGGASSAIIKGGNNTISITGGNTFDGDLYIDGGVIGLNNNAAVSSAATVHIGVTGGANNSTLDSSANGTTIGADIVVESGTGTRTIDQAVGSGTVTFSGDITLNKELNVTAGSGETLVLGGNISGANKIIKAQAGTVELSGNSTYTGNTEIDQGTLHISGDIANGSKVFIGNGTISQDAALQLSGSGATIGDIQVNVASSGTPGRNINVTAGNHTISGTVDLNRNATINASGGTLLMSGTVDLNNSGNNDLTINNSVGVTISGAISASSGASEIIKQGSGTLTISGNNSGSLFMLDIEGGTVALNNINALGSAYADKVNFNSSGTLQVNASVAPANLGIRVASGQVGTLDVVGANTLTVGGALASFGGSGTFTKTGSGTLAISGNSTYTGSFNQNAGVTDVSDTLDASAGISVAGGRLNVGTGAAVGDVSQNGGTVSGGGLIDGNFVQNSGVLSPGNSPGTLFIAGNATWNGGSYLWEVTTVNPGTPGTDWDYVDITGTLTIGGGYTVNVDDLNALPGWNTANNYSWLIATADGGISGFGSLGLNVGGFDQNPYGGSFSLRQDGNDIYLDYTGGPLGPGPGPSAVPEPNALSLTMLAGLLLVSFRQKMRQMRRQVTASA
jgi:autotransporter-associated beta strand protein